MAAARPASSRRMSLISSRVLPARHALADSPRSPNDRQTTRARCPWVVVSAIAPPARHTKSAACALITSNGPAGSLVMRTTLGRMQPLVVSILLLRLLTICVLLQLGGDRVRAAVLGLGEAGGRYAADLAAAGWQLHGFDPGPVPTPPGVLRAQSVAAAVADAELIIALTGASAAVSAAQAAAVSAPQDCCYADFNSSSAALKRQVEAVIATAAGMQMADVAVLAPVGRLGAASPLAVSGPGATAVADAFGAVGAQVEVLDGPVGDAAGRKLLRSVFMKGLAAA